MCLNPTAKVKCHNIIVQHELIIVISLSLRQLDNPLVFGIWVGDLGVSYFGALSLVLCPLLRACLYSFGFLSMGLCTVNQSVPSTM